MERRFGGRDVRDVTQESLAHNVGMVLQNPFLFSGSVFENIRYSTTDASHADVIDAAKAVGLHALIEAMPDGYETMLEEGGGGLSLGHGGRGKAVLGGGAVLQFVC